MIAVDQWPSGEMRRNALKLKNSKLGKAAKHIGPAITSKRTCGPRNYTTETLLRLLLPLCNMVHEAEHCVNPKNEPDHSIGSATGAVYKGQGRQHDMMTRALEIPRRRSMTAMFYPGQDVH